MSAAIRLQNIIDHCSAKPGAEIAFPFGDVPVCFKRGGRIFIEIYPNSDDYKVTLRCEPEFGEYCRRRWPGCVIPGYPVPERQRKYKNTVLLDRGLDEDELLRLIDHSYDTLNEEPRRARHDTGRQQHPH
jgi:predicted DNA-binding protein (MmcQ/YjbR family)